MSSQFGSKLALLLWADVRTLRLPIVTTGTYEWVARDWFWIYFRDPINVLEAWEKVPLGIDES